jgi:hypothetical protein
MSESTDVRNLSELFSAITRAGTYGLAVLANPEASEVAKADASAVVDLTTRKLHELLKALEEEES